MTKQKAVKKTTPKPDSDADQPRDRRHDRSGSGSKDDARREQIAKRAYELWRHRGGDPVENWLAAEAELSSRTSAAAPHKMPNA